MLNLNNLLCHRHDYVTWRIITWYSASQNIVELFCRFLSYFRLPRSIFLTIHDKHVKVLAFSFFNGKEPILLWHAWAFIQFIIHYCNLWCIQWRLGFYSRSIHRHHYDVTYWIINRSKIYGILVPTLFELWILLIEYKCIDQAGMTHGFILLILAMKYWIKTSAKVSELIKYFQLYSSYILQGRKEYFHIKFNLQNLLPSDCIITYNKVQHSDIQRSDNIT